MATDDLIARLTRDLKPVPRSSVAKRLAIGLGLGFAASWLLMVWWLGMRPDITEASATMPFWGKLAYTLLLAVIGAWAVKRIAYPLGSIVINLVLMAVALFAFGILAAGIFAMAPPEMHYTMLTGKSLAVCTFNIVVLSMPLLIGAFWVLRGLAPTRLTVAGAAAGIAAGAIGSVIYSFHCTESAMPFVAIWYTLGVLIPGLIGAVAGRFFLRW